LSLQLGAFVTSPALALHIRYRIHRDKNLGNNRLRRVYKLAVYTRVPK
jgi:hypothetical protein